MRFYGTILDALARVNTLVLAIGRQIAWVLMALMVVVVLVQVWWRYVVGSAFSWTEEAALGLMVWMIGLSAASAWRWGGFVAIDLFPEALPRRVGQVLRLLILFLALGILLVLFERAQAGLNAVTIFNSSGLNRLLQDSGINEWLGTELEFRTNYIRVAMNVYFAVMIAVTVEMILRLVGRLIWGEDAFPEPDTPPALITRAE